MTINLLMLLATVILAYCAYRSWKCSENLAQNANMTWDLQRKLWGELGSNLYILHKILTFGEEWVYCSNGEGFKNSISRCLLSYYLSRN